MATSIRQWRIANKPTQPFSNLEWKVIEMARDDGRWSLNPDGIVASLVRTLFGVPVPPETHGR